MVLLVRCINQMGPVGISKGTSGFGKGQYPSGKCRMSSRTSASVLSVTAEGMTSGLGSGRDHFERGDGTRSSHFAATA